MQVEGFHPHADTCTCSPAVCEQCGALCCLDYIGRHAEWHELVMAVCTEVAMERVLKHGVALGGIHTLNPN